MIARRVVRVMSLLAALVIVTLPTLARAQGGERWVVPNADGVALRCGPSSVMNPVTTIGRASVLKADIEKDGYVRVAYPAGTYAVVPSEEGELKDGSVVLTRRSRLKAYSKNDPVIEECWRALLDDFLVPGTKLKHVGPMNNRAGAAAGFVVEAPAGSFGWVLSGDVRTATADEIKRVAAVPANVMPTKAEPAPAPANTTPPPAPANETPAPSSTPASTEPTAQPNTGAQPGTGEPAADPTKTAMPTEQGAAPAAPVVEPVKPKAPPPLSPEQLLNRKIKQLDQSFDVLNKEPIESAEFEPLIAEYENAKREALNIGASARVESYVNTRLELLALRLDHQKTSRAIRELQDRAKRGADDIADRIKKLAKGREYQVVGRMTASVLYDGKRLPLLYRVVSIDTNVSRTVAYLSPAPDQNLDSFLGAIVGVNGDGTTDPGARVRVITPTQIEILQAAGAQ